MVKVTISDEQAQVHLDAIKNGLQALATFAEQFGSPKRDGLKSAYRDFAEVEIGDFK